MMLEMVNETIKKVKLVIEYVTLEKEQKTFRLDGYSDIYHLIEDVADYIEMSHEDD